MTDFATLPDYRDRGLAQRLLTHMEAQMSEKGLKTAYTIGRDEHHLCSQRLSVRRHADQQHPDLRPTRKHERLVQAPERLIKNHF